ncbi:glycosyltransferase family 2 protein [Komarekiella sp. 'clone 1']|uniref:Glycosyltransferase family 2 protein n=1 Tax=Komarekiella delphini-convector SJRDD-AB1 TaxID=2593771 RepID=A0AA40VQQ5_9NOST|nr:glycosyltransferase family 2 protein [Komarekiella delphini-convector]MBD6616527.1 glycosyltransferase family 2 protein [Komarekiella delphini-convector SJRDD-AB1]
MNKLLTLAIPTYNRANLLDKQLAWLAQAIKGFESDCEIFISDNCSTDNTQEIIKKWQLIIDNVIFKSNKNNKNIGVMGNIACCLKATTTKYVWTIGDDDPIQENTLNYLLTTLKKHSDLALIFLNFSGRDKRTGQIVVERWLNSDNDEPKIDGREVFQGYLNNNFGGILFISAAIYQTNVVQCALQKWPSATTNWASQAYWAGFCAAHGSVIVTKDIYLECTMGASLLDLDPTWNLKMRYAYIPEVYIKLLTIGYPNKFCREMIWQNFRQKTDWKIFLGALKRWPFLTIKIFIHYLVLLTISGRTYSPGAKISCTNSMADNGLGKLRKRRCR